MKISKINHQNGIIAFQNYNFFLNVKCNKLIIKLKKSNIKQ